MGPEAIHGLPNLVHGCEPIDVMHLIEINVVNLQPFQAGIAGHLYMARRKAPVIDVLRHGLMDLCRQDDAVATGRILHKPLPK